MPPYSPFPARLVLPILPGREENVRIQKARNEYEDETRFTTFPEYIEYCHDYLSKTPDIDTYRILQPIAISDVEHPKRDMTLCQTYLRPWRGFEEMQIWVYNDVLETLGSREVFTPRNVIKSDGWRLCREALVSEAHLSFHLEYGVGKPAERIMPAMQESGLSRFDLNDKGGIVFQYRGDGNDGLPQASAVRNDSNKTLLFYIQEKHKMTPEDLRVGLRQPDFWKKVIRRSEVPGDMSEQLMYNAEYLAGTALAQAYDTMVHRGTPYGVLATGSCLVFLHVGEDDPETLYYFLSEPILDVQAMLNRGDTNWMKKPVTAVGRLLALSLMSTLEPTRTKAG